MRERPPRAAALYLRISLDQSGERLGVMRQEEDCRAEAERRGWRVAEVYEDDDRTAFNPKKPRPEYQRLLQDIQAGLRDGVMIWRLDRLHRQPRELEEFIVVCDRHNVALATVTGEVDLSTSQGRLLARTWGAFAAHECEVRGERLSRAWQQRASRGVMPGTGRLYGYDVRTKRVNARQAAVIREVAKRLLRGEAIYSICTDLNRRPRRAPRGGKWTHPSLRRLMLNPRLAGFSSYRGKVVAKGTWAAILSPAQHYRLVALLTDPARNLNVNPPRWYLLRRTSVCGKCGGPVVGGAVSGVRHYQCLDRPGARGCGRVVMRADRLEAALAQTIAERLRSDDLRRAIETARVGDIRWQRAQVRHDAAEERLASLSRDYARGLITRSEWLGARPALLEQLRNVKGVLDADRAEAVLRDLLDDPAQFESIWSQSVGSRKRAIVLALVEQIIVLPAQRTHGPPEERIVVWWRGEPRPHIDPRRLGGIPALRRSGAFDGCSVEGCEQPYVASGFCSMHYQRQRKYGDPGSAARRHQLPYREARCLEHACPKSAQLNGRCPAHNQVWVRRDPSRPGCVAANCDRPAIAKGMCTRHYARCRRLPARR